MKNLFLVLFSCFTFISSISAQEKTGELIVEIQNLKTDKGKLLVGLYDSKNNWLGQSIMGEVSDIKNGKAQVTFKDVPYGSYAISSYQDENENNELDAGLFGIPKEPYASSRGAKGTFGPPKWNDAVFKVEAQSTTEIILY
jgi:uncharacterized protein (DUF2141 family)